MRLRAILLDGLGYDEARFSPLRLDFTDGAEPTDTVVWLDNGGGKTSLSSLVFTVLRPNRREFIATLREAKYRLEHYVLARDTGHVALLWDVTPPGALVAHQLVTGQVLEWKDRTVSPDPTRLQRTSYGFVVRPGTLDLDHLPTHDQTGARRSLRSYLDTLRQANSSDPQLQLAIETDQRRWLRWLDDHHLDPDLLRQQVVMNGEEGGATRLFAFTDAWEFADLLVRLLVDDHEVNDLVRTVTNLRDKYLRQSSDRAELALCEAAAPTLARIERAYTATTDARSTLTSAVLDATDLRDSLARAVHDDLTAADRDARDAETHRGEERRCITEINRVEARRQQARWDAAKLRATDATTERDRLGVKAAAAAAELRGWRLVEPALQVAAADEQIRTIESQLAAAEDRLSHVQARADAAAVRYAAKLAAQRDAHLAAAAAADDEASSEQGAAAQHRQRREQLREQVAAADATIAAARKHEQRAEELRAALATDGIVSDDETVGEARSRWDAAADQARDDRAAARAVADTADGDLETANAAATRAAADIARLEADEDSKAALLRRLTGRRDQLLASELLTDLAGGPVTLPRDLDAVLEVADDQAHELTARAETGRAQARAIDARLARLDDDGVEVSDDVTGIVDTLHHNGVAAVAGWRYLTDGIGTPAERAALVATDPAALAGVVLTAPDADLTVARQTLHDLRPTDPITVTTADGLHTTGADGRFVLAPAAERYDPEAAAQLHAQLTAEAAELHAAADTAEAEAAARRELATDLRRWAADGGRDLDRLDSELAATRTALSAARDDATAAAAAVADATGRRRDADTARQAAETHLETASLHLLRLATAEQAEQAADDASRDRAAAETQLPSLRAAADQEARDAAAADLRRAAAADRASDARTRAATIVDLASEEQVDLPTDTPADAGTLPHRETLLAELRRARDEVRQLTPDATLQARLDQLRDSTTEPRAALAAADPGDLTRARELVASPDAASVTARRQALTTVEQRLADLTSRHAVVAADVERLTAEATQLAPTGRQRYADLTDFPITTVTEADALVERFDHEADQLRRRRDTAAKQASEAAARAAERRTRAQLIGRDRDRLTDQLTTAAAALDHSLSDTSESTVTAFNGDADHARARVDTAVTGLRAGHEQLDAAATSLTSAAARARALADDHPDADQVMREKIAAAGSESNAATAADLAGAIDLRAAHLRAELASAGQERDLTVDQLRSHTERTLKLFGKVERLSRIPDSIEAWAGKPFVKVTMNPPDPAALREQVAAVVDDCLASGTVPEGRELTLLTLKRVLGAEGLQFSLLKPTDTMEVKRQPVHAFAASDGQKLTAAILLYCTLARLRFDQRGLDPALAGGLLWLDNPFGKATKMDLVELQRQVAAKMGVQLVYLTGVKDYDAVDAFTRRNNLAKAIDPATGHTVVVGASLWRRPDAPNVA